MGKVIPDRRSNLSNARRGNWRAKVGFKHWGWARTRAAAQNLFKRNDGWPRTVQQINTGELWVCRSGAWHKVQDRWPDLPPPCC